MTTANRHPLRRALTALSGAGVAVFAASQLSDNAAWAALLIPSAYLTFQTVFALLKSAGIPVVPLDSADHSAHRVPPAQINPASGMFLSAGGLDGSGQAFGCRTDRR